MAFEVQKITTNRKTEVNYSISSYNSITFTNTHATDEVTIDLYVADQTGLDITATDVYAAETEVKSSSSVTLTVDNGSGSASDAASDEFDSERVYKSTGVFFGTCTSVSSTTALVFSGGLEKAITNNDVLHVGTRYHILNNVEIPNGVSLKLTSDEFNFNNERYKLYIVSNTSGGKIDIIKR
ncbi:hypothetical protein N9987_00390 [bacterium]|nr:hypothetical protein [bacterium]